MSNEQVGSITPSLDAIVRTVDSESAKESRTSASTQPTQAQAPGHANVSSVPATSSPETTTRPPLAPCHLPNSTTTVDAFEVEWYGEARDILGHCFTPAVAGKLFSKVREMDMAAGHPKSNVRTYSNFLVLMLISY